MPEGLKRLRRNIDNSIEPHPFRESEFEVSNPVVQEIMKYGREIFAVAQTLQNLSTTVGKDA